MTKPTLLLGILATAAWCQPVSFGVKGGVSLEESALAPSSRSDIDKPRWTVGPTVEFRLPHHLAIGADALYRHFEYASDGNVGITTFFDHTTGAHWEFPLYVKYRIAESRIRPFVAVGGAAEYVNRTSKGGCSGDPQLCPSQFQRYEYSTSGWGGGAVFGGGVEFKAGLLTFAPEFRYTYWPRGYLVGGNTSVPQVLLGIRF